MRLQLSGYRVVCAEDGEQALELFHSESPDLIVLDVMLPKLDGFAVCRRLRAESCVPIIFLSAVEAISERVAGLDLGADDYLPKPFSPKELEARIATILRRVGRGNVVVESRELPTGQGVLRLGELVVDTNRRQVNRGSERINLTYTEFSLLELSHGLKSWSNCGGIPLAELPIFASSMSMSRVCAASSSPIHAIQNLF
jgi:DNA-binding response OmpR family regulator